MDVDSGIFEVEIDGKNYKISPFSIGDYGDFRNYLKGKKLKIYLDAGGNDPEVVEKILNSGIEEKEMYLSLDAEVKWLLKRVIGKNQEITDLEVDKLTSVKNIEVISKIIASLIKNEKVEGDETKKK